MKIIEQGRPCGKPNPLVCPRHRFANGIDVAQAQKVLKVQDVIGNSSALTYEEIGLMYPNEKGGDSNG
ncbi:MAG TPA: hypothetical protein VKC53_01955 [Patescibacteria group bacterium]|nr:hypothetical protein [Patescibacteria group bacterium]